MGNDSRHKATLLEIWGNTFYWDQKKTCLKSLVHFISMGSISSNCVDFSAMFQIALHFTKRNDRLHWNIESRNLGLEELAKKLVILVLGLFILVTAPFCVQFPFDSCPSNDHDKFVLTLAYDGTALISVMHVWALLIMYKDVDVYEGQHIRKCSARM